MSEKLCVFCRNLEMDTSACHGDYPEAARFTCRKGHWSEEILDYVAVGEQEGFRSAILIAETCPDYDEASTRK